MNIIFKHTNRVDHILTLFERIKFSLKSIKIIFVIVSSISIFSTNVLLSQPGNIFLKNYSPSINNIENINNSIAQGNNGIMYFANPSGILSYDGKNWDLITIPSIPLVLVTNPNNNRIYVGCRKDFGYIEYDETGKEHYNSISGYYSNFEDISKILVTKDYVYFYCTKQIFCYSITNNNLTQVLPPAWNDRFSGIFLNNGVVYVNISGKGIHDIKGNKLWILNSDLANQTILANIPLSVTSTLIYTDKNIAYTFNGFKLTPFKLEDEDYLKDKTVINGIDLPGNLFVLTTLSGGCIIINKHTGKTNSIINYQTGLPDNEIQAVATDKLGGLWITHNYGVTRADNQLPITSYSSYPGLKGNLTDVLKIDEKLYVATSEGVYILSQTLFEEPSVSTKDRKKFKEQVKECKKDKNINTTSIKLTEPLIYNSPSLSKSYNPCSFEYAFKKINGIDKKCNQLLYRNGKIFTATITDLYEIENGSAKAVIKNIHINTIYLPLKQPNQIYIGTDDGLLIYYIENGKFNTIDLGINFSSIVEDERYNLWVGSINKVIKFEINKSGELSRQITYPLSARYSDYTKVRNIDGNLWFFSGYDIYHYDNQRDLVYKDTIATLNPTLDKIIYAKNDQFTWIYKDMFWNCYTNECRKNDNKIITLSIVNNVRQIYVDNEKNCWVINDDNVLYRVTTGKIENHRNTNLFIREAKSASGKMLSINNIVLEHNNNSIRFMIINPYFINEKANQYQYILEGAMNEWSSWSTDKTIDFPYLPYGSFKLYVRAKNVFGDIIEHKGVHFSVASPYWLRWWFYLIEIGGVVLLLTLSIYYNKSKNTSFLSKSLLLLSVVISFKLIQAVIESNISVSPVFDFSVSVTMVYAILKVEKIIIKKLSKNTRMLKTRILWVKRKKLYAKAENEKQ